MITQWLAAAAAVGATIVAIVSVVTSRRTGRDALAAQADAMRQSQEHERALVRDDRLWARRADLYARIVEAVRAHVEAATPGPAAEDHRLTSLVSESEVLASSEMADLINKFVYNDPSQEARIDIWNEIVGQARVELIGRPTVLPQARPNRPLQVWRSSSA